jgi:hypothetical protein
MVLDPLALRPRLSPGLPLSFYLQLHTTSFLLSCGQKKQAWKKTQACQRIQNQHSKFGNLAIIAIKWL